MAQGKIDLTTEADKLSGKERAKLIFRNATEERQYGKGFLSESETRALLRMPDNKASEEFNLYKEVFNKTPLIMGAVAETYLKFKYNYETLQKCLYLMNCSAVSLYVTGAFKSKAEKTEEPAFKMLKGIRAMEIKENTLIFDRELKHIKDAVETAYEQACYFVSMEKIVEKVINLLGFSPFLGKRYDEFFKRYIEEVEDCIKSYNTRFKEILEECQKITGATFKEDLKDYLIAEPIATDISFEWLEEAEGKGRG